MRLTELLNKDEVTISCELFPPKQGAQLENYKNIVKDMAALKPAYMSVTYGAGGGTSEYTVSIAENILKNFGVTPIAHLTCVSSTKEAVQQQLSRLKTAGIENILALRGDIPADSGYRMEDHVDSTIYFDALTACMERYPEFKGFQDMMDLYGTNNL